MKTGAQILGEAIEKDRNIAGLSQEDIAKEVGVTQQALSGWEAGTSMPRTTRLARLALTFGDGSNTVEAIKTLFPRNWGNQISQALNAPSAAQVLKMSTEERNEHTAAQMRSAISRADRNDSRGFVEPQDREHHRRPRTVEGFEQPVPHYVMKEEHALILPSGASRNNAPLELDERDRSTLQDAHDALVRAADDVRFARQALDRTAEQIERAIKKLPKR